MLQLNDVAALKQLLLDVPTAAAMAAQPSTRAELHAYWQALKVPTEGTTD